MKLKAENKWLGDLGDNNNSLLIKMLSIIIMAFNYKWTLHLWSIFNFAHKILFLFAINKQCFSIKWVDLMGGKAWQDKNSRRKKS